MAGDLAIFREANGRKTAMEERVRLIQAEFPSVAELDWKRAFDHDIDLFGRIVRDILKIDQTVPGRPGPRPEPDPERAMASLRQLMGQDYTHLPFCEAFTILADGRSYRQLARKVDMSVMTVHRLRAGQLDPTMIQMSQVADAFGKHGSFFAEYRALVIAGAIVYRLERSPESSIGIYRRLVGVAS